MFEPFSVRLLSAGSIYKMLVIGLVASFLPLGLLFGVMALAGADAVKWNNEPIHGVAGLFAGPLIGVVVALVFSALVGTATVLGLWLYSKFRALSMSAIGLRPHVGDDV